MDIEPDTIEETQNAENLNETKQENKSQTQTVHSSKKRKRVKFLDTFLQTEETIDKREEKSKAKRLKLSLKIFKILRDKNENYFTKKTESPKGQSPTGATATEQIDKTTKNKVQTPPEFDHLEAFRPCLDILEELKQPQVERFTPALQYLKVGDEEYKSWMSNVVWDSKDVKIDFRNDIHTLNAGWIPSANQRTWNQFLCNGIKNHDASSPQSIYFRNMLNSLNSLAQANNDLLSVDSNNWFSLFPPETSEFSKNNWLNDVILCKEDVFSTSNLPLEVDPFYKIDLEIEADIDQNERQAIKINHKNERASFNWAKFLSISNEDYYIPNKGLDLFEDDVYRVLIRHALPALDLQRTLFPTYMDTIHMRRWHRPLLTQFEHGPKMKTGEHLIKNLTSFINHSFTVYGEIISAAGSQEAFLMKSLKDLTVMNGHLILLEYSEEYPPLMSQIGMNSILRNYYAKKSKNDKFSENVEFGEVSEIPANITPFLGNIKAGEHILTLENNMFRAPVYKHISKNTDFLVIRNVPGYFIRPIPVIFVVGQQCPKIEVPSPNSKIAMRYGRDRLQTYIYRLFLKSKENPKRLKIANIRRAFKQHSENSIRKRLKTCAEYSRNSSITGKSNHWILKPDFRLPTLEDMHEKLKPEMICSYYSMWAAQRRLKDAGYGRRNLFVEEEDIEEESDDKNIDEEILCAPWHTTKAFLLCQRGKCLMSINSFADPTGCGEGFSYVRFNYKSPRDESNVKSTHQSESKKSKNITGTDADLRKLKMNQCRQILSEMGVSTENINKMQRWDMINAIRRLGTMSSKAGNLQDAIGKFARSAKSSTIESLDKYREECQFLFDLQNRTLASTYEMSSDEEDENDDEANSELNLLTRNLENMLDDKNISNIIADNDEELDRQDLLRLLQENINESYSKNETGQARSDQSPLPVKLLVHRTFIESDKRFKRTETVVDPRIISAYLKITKNPNYRQTYARHDSKTMDQLRKEKKRLQDQLRRMTKQDETEEKNNEKSDKDLKFLKHKTKSHMRCTACGDFGHMRTNRICPKYYETHPMQANMISDSKSADVVESIYEEIPVSVDTAVQVEGTRLLVGKALVEAADELTKLNSSKHYKDNFGRRGKHTDEDYSYDFEAKGNRVPSRRRTDPKICLQAIFEDILIRLKELPHSLMFSQPVCTKKVPDYLSIVKNPLDLLTMRDNCKRLKYTHRNVFLEDIQQIRTNSVLYNGLTNPITLSADKVLEDAKKMIEERDKEIGLLEIEINPLLSSDPLIRMSHIFESIIMNAKGLAAAHPFLMPVNTKVVRDYYSFVQKPMDLETMRINCCNGVYENCDSFLNDVDLIVNNCTLYNGPNHLYSKMARELRDHIYTMIQKKSEYLMDAVQQIQPPNSLAPDSSGPTSNELSNALSQNIAMQPTSVPIENADEEIAPVESKKDDLLEDLDISDTSHDEENL